jgi:U4/U6.U5 tri-snRNP component SNU23
MSNNKKSVNVERRTWDVAAYEQKALARKQQQEQEDSTIPGDKNDSHNVNSDSANQKEEFIPAPVGAIGPEGSQRAYLQARKRKVADFIDERVGSTTLISTDDAVGSKKLSSEVGGSNATAALGTDTIKITDGVTKSSSGGVGFHCNVCDCYLKDSLTYLDHVNGRKHQRKLGYTMRVERSTETDVLTKLNELKKVKQQVTTMNDMDVIDYNKIVQEKDIDEERRREERQRLRKERRKRHTGSENNDPPCAKEVETAKDMPDDQYTEAGDEEVEEYDDDEPEALIDPAMAAMMGFTGFGGT